MEFKDLAAGEFFFYENKKYLKCNNGKAVSLDTYEYVQFHNVHTVYKTLAKQIKDLVQGDIFILRRKLYMVLDIQLGLTIGLECGTRVFHPNTTFVELIIPQNYCEPLYKLEARIEYDKKYKDRKH